MMVAPRVEHFGPEAILAPAAVVVLGCSTAAALGGFAAGMDALAITTAGLAGTALLILMAGDWIDPFAALVLTLPLPALYAAGDLRLAPALPVTALVLAAWFMSWAPTARRLHTAQLPAVSGLVFLLVYTLAGVLSDHRGAALREIANMVLIGALLVVATDTFVRRPDRALSVATLIAMVAGALGLLALLETLRVIPGQFPESGVNRAALGFGQPNGLGMFLALSLPFADHARRVRPEGAARIVATACLALTIAGLAGTFSRGSWLSVLSGAAVLTLLGEWKFVFRVAGLALLAALVVDLATAGAIHETVFGTLADWSVAQRAALMLAGIRLFLEHPLIGAGPGSFAAELDRLGALVPTLRDLKATPHNAYIQIAAESGLAGLLAFGALLAGLLRRALLGARSAEPGTASASLHRAALWTLAIACAEGMVEWPLSHGHAQLVVIAAAIACAGVARVGVPS